MTSLLKLDTFALKAVREGHMIRIHGFFVAPSPGFTYTAATDKQLTKPPYMLGATINMLRPNRYLPHRTTQKAVQFAVPDRQGEFTHVQLLLSICGVTLKRVILPIQ